MFVEAPDRLAALNKLVQDGGHPIGVFIAAKGKATVRPFAEFNDDSQVELFLARWMELFEASLQSGNSSQNN